MSEAVGPTGRVVAIDAVPDMAEPLVRHSHGNAHLNVEVIGVALGATKGRVDYFVVADDPCLPGTLRLPASKKWIFLFWPKMRAKSFSRDGASRWAPRIQAPG